MLVSRKRSLVRNGRSRSSFGSEFKDDVSPRGMSVQRGEKLEGSSAIPIKESVLSTQSTQSVQVGTVRNVLDHVLAPNEDFKNLEMRFAASCPKQGEKVIRSDGKLQLGVSGTGNKFNRSNGGKGKRSLKRQYPSASVSSQGAGTSKNLQSIENGGVLIGSSQYDRQSEKERLGSLAAEQACGGSRRGYSPDKGVSDDKSGMVRRGVGPGVEGNHPNNSGESQNREIGAGSSSLGFHSQPMVELHNGRAVNFMGGVRSLEQEEKAIGDATLRRIQMGDSGKVISGPEGLGYGINGESSNVEVNSNSHPCGRGQCVDQLQGRGDGNIEAHIDMETGVEALEGIVEEAGMEYGGSRNDES